MSPHLALVAGAMRKPCQELITLWVLPLSEPKITITLWSGQIPGAGAGYVAGQYKRLESGRVTGA